MITWQRSMYVHLMLKGIIMALWDVIPTTWIPQQFVVQMNVLTFHGSLEHEINAALDLDIFPISICLQNKQQYIGSDNSTHLGAHDQALFPPSQSLSLIAVAVGCLSMFYSTM